MLHGIITPDSEADAALAAGADYLEPTIVGNLLVQREDGSWHADPVLPRRECAPSFAVLCPAEHRLSDPSYPLEDTHAYLRVAFGAIAEVATPGAFVVLGSGAARRIPEGVSRVDARRQFARSVSIAREIAAAYDLEVILEPLHRGETDQINSLVEALEFLDEFGMGEMRVVADLFHIMLEHESFEVVRSVAGRVAHAHIADTGRTPPGQGDWPLAEFLQALRGGGYQGRVSIECIWADLAAEAGPALAALRAADPATAAVNA